MSDTRIGLLPTLLLSGAIAFAGWSVGKGVEAFRTADRSVTVKGLAEQDVKSDFAVWTLGFRRAGNEFGEVQRALTADREKVVAFLREQGFGDAEIEVRPLQVQDLLAREWGANNVALRFNGQGQVTVKSARVDSVAEAANKVDPLIQAGIQLAGDNEGMGGPRFQLRGFNDVKPKLLQEATLSAREQAQKFAADAGATLGPLKNANQGVIRVLDDDGSDMDTSRTVGKRLRVVSTFEFALR
ncbi:MAG: SIMPL domain-containing protein [Betaproteobacteria bacterium HGW-Betaproteobacteria-21]|nr:MAG: SIMPL domain-containing protein [Betaproteobacteria bacterium HGW-Betaproteobacteria-21]